MTAPETTRPIMPESPSPLACAAIYREISAAELEIPDTSGDH